MAQPSNNITTLLISDPNGGQPQMIKVMGGAKIPIQLATSSGSMVSSTGIKNYIKTNAGSNEQGGAILQTGKVQNRQIIAVPAKQGLQSIRGQVIVPVSSVQLKPQIRNEQIAGIVAGRSTPSVISSPMVIRTQTGQMAVTNNHNTTAIQAPIQLPHINVSKPAQANNVTASLLQTQLKQNAASTSSRQPSLTLKTQFQQTPKPSEFIFLQQKQIQEVLGQQTQQIQQTQPDSSQQQPQQQQKPRNVQAQQPPQKQPSSQQHGLNSTKSLMNTSILDHSGSRKRHDFDFDYSVESKRRKTEKGGKGLRHFSMKVCEKVQAKGTTSYNEVADELVNEFTETNRSNSPSDGANYDQKNIRRRVYDALNVLMAMNIISKEKKEIRWLGLPTNSVQECRKLTLERKRRIQKINLKTQQLQDLILQQIAFKNLVERNRAMEKENGSPSPNSTIQLPFIIVNTGKKTVIDCSISNDKTEYLFNFDNTFEIHDDIEVLKRMGMALGLDKGNCTPEDLQRAKTLVPKALSSYVVELAEGTPAEGSLEAKGALDDFTTVGLEDLDSGVIESLPSGEFSFEKFEPASIMGVPLKQYEARGSSTVGGDLSRHSSLLSLSQDQRTESESPSSFGDDFDGDGFEDSDVDIS